MSGALEAILIALGLKKKQSTSFFETRTPKYIQSRGSTALSPASLFSVRSANAGT